MRQKRKLIASGVLLGAMLTCTALAGCGNNTAGGSSDNSNVTATTKAEVTTADSKTTSAGSVTAASSESTTKSAITDFKIGTWESKSNGEIDGYYYFNSSENRAKFVPIEGKSGVPMTYTINGSTVEYSSFTPEAKDTMTVTFTDETHATLKLSDGKVRTISYISEGDTCWDHVDPSVAAINK